MIISGIPLQKFLQIFDDFKVIVQPLVAADAVTGLQISGFAGLFFLLILPTASIIRKSAADIRFRRLAGIPICIAP